MLRKNFSATGSFLNVDRPQALDLLGFSSQLVFDTFTSSPILRFDRDGDHELAVTFARAQHRAILDWCSVDPRLLPVTVVARRRHGCRGCAHARSRSTPVPRRSRSVSTARPITHRVTSASIRCGRCARKQAYPCCCTSRARARSVMPPDYFENGRPAVPDFHGGDTNFKSIDYMSIPLPVMQTLNALVIDGVLQRHPALRIGVIELGASWLPGWMRMLDSAHEAFRKNEERLQQMEMKPSEYVQRQIRATPYPHEDTGWTIANSGPSVALFSSDFPHVEGGRNPDRALRAQHGRGRHRRRRPRALLRRQLRRPDGSGARSAGSGHRRLKRRLRGGASCRSGDGAWPRAAPRPRARSASGPCSSTRTGSRIPDAQCRAVGYSPCGRREACHHHTPLNRLSKWRLSDVAKFTPSRRAKRDWLP